MATLDIIVKPKLKFTLKRCGDVVPYGITPEERAKLAGIEENANNYTHPETHPASIITQDANNRFVTDAEKTTWNAKASTDVATTSVAGLMSSSDKTKLDGIATGANNYTHPETHPSSILDVVDAVNGAANKFLNERGEMVEVSHENLTDKNSEAAFQHVDITTTKSGLDSGDKVALYDSVTGKVVLSTALNDIETILASI